MRAKSLAALLCVSLVITGCNPYRTNAEEVARIDNERAYARRQAEARAQREAQERQRAQELAEQQMRQEQARRAALTPAQRDAEDRQRAEAERQRVARANELARQQQAERLRVAQERAEEQKKKDQKMAGIMGAFGGAMAAAGAGASPDVIVEAAKQGAALATGGSVDPTALGGAGASTGAAGYGAGGATQSGSGAGKPTGVAGTFPTKPMHPGFEQACSMMNLQNYRTVALEKGGDVQLKTMCGQAYEYYWMYLNAIRQGYSEADCNRTHAAHVGSARVAIDYAKRGE